MGKADYVFVINFHGPWCITRSFSFSWRWQTSCRVTKNCRKWRSPLQCCSPSILQMNNQTLDHFIKVCNRSRGGQVLTGDGFRGEGKTRIKTSRNRVENQQTQPTCDAGSGNRTLDTLSKSECCHHFANPAALKISFAFFNIT